VKITKDYALAASKAFQTLASEAKPFNFVYVSGRGATVEPSRFSPIFARVKGETEVALAGLRKANPQFHASSVRPAGVVASEHDAIKPYIPTPSLPIRLGHSLIGVLGVVMPSSLSPTQPLGRFLTEMAMGRHTDNSTAPDISKIGEFPIVENTAFRRLSGM
jgi:hypothetical protein